MKKIAAIIATMIIALGIMVGMASPSNAATGANGFTCDHTAERDININGGTLSHSESDTKMFNGNVHLRFNGYNCYRPNGKIQSWVPTVWFDVVNYTDWMSTRTGGAPAGSVQNIKLIIDGTTLITISGDGNYHGPEVKDESPYYSAADLSFGAIKVNTWVSFCTKFQLSLSLRSDASNTVCTKIDVTPTAVVVS